MASRAASAAAAVAAAADATAIVRKAKDGQPAGFVNENERFGAVPDEIDTTPTDTRHAPGAPSAPVWSLKDDIPDTTPTDEPPKPGKKGWWQRTFGGE